MITGDHKDTAQAIADQIGLKHTSNVPEGIDIDRLSDQDLAKKVSKVDVFARTTPEHKLRIVKLCRKMAKSLG